MDTPTNTTTPPTGSGDPTRSIFGSIHLGYVVVETRRFTDWHRFGADAIGLHVDVLDSDVMRFRMDDHSCRFLLQRGPAEDLVAAGWEIDDHETFDEVLRRVTARGVPIEEGTPDECRLRGVERLWRFPGPKGIKTEIFTTAVRSDEPLRMQISAFVTDDAGMGHLALTTKHPEELRSYYNSARTTTRSSTHGSPTSSTRTSAA